MLDFTEKVVLITGASRGIGRATAVAFARQGARVAVHYNSNLPAAEETLAQLDNGPHQLFQANVADPNAIQQLARDVIAAMGRIDVLVNNAGIFEEHPLSDTDYATWQKRWKQSLEVNLLGPANLTYLVAQRMITQGGGHIVNVSSRGAFRGEPDAPGYGASKAGLNAMSQSLAKHLAPHNVYVTVVAPGWVETDMAAETLDSTVGDEVRNQSPLGRVARPEEVAYTIMFLASEGAEFLTGAIIDVNGASYLRS